jgi:hypothetical protein
VGAVTRICITTTPDCAWDRGAKASSASLHTHGASPALRACLSPALACGFLKFILKYSNVKDDGKPTFALIKLYLTVYFAFNDNFGFLLTFKQLSCHQLGCRRRRVGLEPVGRLGGWAAGRLGGWAAGS